jgi:hypothetical protein
MRKSRWLDRRGTAGGGEGRLDKDELILSSALATRGRGSGAGRSKVGGVVDTDATGVVADEGVMLPLSNVGPWRSEGDRISGG